MLTLLFSLWFALSTPAALPTPVTKITAAVAARLAGSEEGSRLLAALGVVVAGRQSTEVARDLHQALLTQPSQEAILAAIAANNGLSHVLPKVVPQTQARSAFALVQLPNIVSAQPIVSAIAGGTEWLATATAVSRTIGTELLGPGVGQCREFDARHFAKLFALTAELKAPALPSSKCEARQRLLAGARKVFGDGESAALTRINGLAAPSRCGIFQQAAVGPGVCP